MAIEIGDRVKVANWRDDQIGVVLRMIGDLALVSFDGRERLLWPYTLVKQDLAGDLAGEVAANRRARVTQHGGDLAAARAEAIDDAFDRR